MGRIIGIDLGTTNSLAAVWNEGRVQLIPNALGEYLTPSVVSFDEDGTYYVGKIARERLVTLPQNTVSVFKRFMGTSKKYHLAGKVYRPEELSALVLKKLKEDAEQYLGEPVEEAALACQKLDMEEEALMLVFDFGGGTLDVSLVDCFDNIIEIMAVSGDNHLGGCDFDLVIAKAFCRKNGIRWEELNAEKQAVLLENAVEVKMALTEAEECVMEVETEEIQGSMPLTRARLIQLSEELFARMAHPVRQVMEDGKVNLQQVKKIVLVGGSCKMVVVRKYLQHLLGTMEIHTVNPDHMIAIGAGIYAGIKERNGEIKDMLLTDICPFSLSTGVVNYGDEKNLLTSVVIERNSALPASREIHLRTAHENQTQVEIGIYQGEEMYVKNNIQLGTITVNVPRRPKGEEVVRLRYTHDVNGILVVDVTVISTGEKKQLLIVNPESGMQPEEIQRHIQKLEKLKVHPREKEENQLLLERGARLYKETVGELRENIEQRMKYFSYLLEQQDEYKIKRWARMLNCHFDGIEEYLRSIRMTWNQTGNFAQWYQENRDQDDQESKEEEENYEYWKESYYTS